MFPFEHTLTNHDSIEVPAIELFSWKNKKTGWFIIQSNFISMSITHSKTLDTSKAEVGPEFPLYGLYSLTSYKYYTNFATFKLFMKLENVCFTESFIQLHIILIGIACVY